MTFLERLGAARDARERDYVELKRGESKGGAASDTVTELLEYLEHLDDAGWAEVRAIEARALDVFSGLARPAEEFEHDQHELWAEFVASLERALVAFAERRGRSAASLLADVRAAHARGDADALVAAVAEATDFEAWARDMRRCAALRTYAVPGSSSAHWGPERGFANLRRRSRSFSDDD